MGKVMVITPFVQRRVTWSQMLLANGLSVRVPTETAEQWPRVDVVLIQLAGDDASSHLQLRRAVSRTAGVPVVAVSPAATPARMRYLSEAGVSDVVNDPDNRQEILGAIYRHESAAGSAPGTSAVLALDPDHRSVVVRGRRVHLTQREYALLAHLVNWAGHACSRQQLLNDVWGLSFDPGSNVVDVCVRRLRPKLPPRTIETVRNFGYRLA